jgi:hypothetical protein
MSKRAEQHHYGSAIDETPTQERSRALCNLRVVLARYMAGKYQQTDDDARVSSARYEIRTERFVGIACPHSP